MSNNENELNPTDAKQESGKGLDETPCSPSSELRAMHRVLQFIRPLLVAIEGDKSAPKWRQERAGMALCACDEAMIAADIAHPEYDFYSENVSS